MRLQGLLGTTGDDFTWAMQTNFFAALRATRAALPSMLNQGSGSIVNIGSVNAFFEPDAGVLDYGAAKAALLNLTKSKRHHRYTDVADHHSHEKKDEDSRQAATSAYCQAT